MKKKKETKIRTHRIGRADAKKITIIKAGGG